MESKSFKRFGGLCAIGAGVAGLLYAISFVVVARSNPQLGGLLSAVFLTLGGLFSSAVFIALYLHLEGADRGFALWAALLGVIASIGSAVHGAYDLANAIHVPDSIPANLANLPNPVDPRGLLTFGLAGVAVLVVAWLSVRSGRLPRSLGYLGYVLGILLVLIYLARLIILDATNPLIVVAVVVTGFIVNPLWNVWLGATLRRE